VSVLRARMKPGVRPIIINGIYQVPEYPTYWEVPAIASTSIALYVADGQIEYEDAGPQRTPQGTFSAPGLEPVQRPVSPAASQKFSRKRG
jgi:hypothetical protein